MRPNSPPPSAKRRGPSAGEGTTSDAEGLGTSPISRRPAWGDAGARQRGSRQEENRRELWASAKRMDVHGLCEISMLPFWQVRTMCPSVTLAVCLPRPASLFPTNLLFSWTAMCARSNP